MASLDFIIQYLPGPIKNIPVHVDYKGQERAEQIFQVIIVICAFVGFIWGYVEQRFSYTVYATLFGFAFSCLIIAIPWPFLRVRKDLKWQEDITPEPKNESEKKKKK